MTDNGIEDCRTDAESTGLPLLRTWKQAYILVLVSFVLWVGLLIALTGYSA